MTTAPSPSPQKETSWFSTRCCVVLGGLAASALLGLVVWGWVTADDVMEIRQFELVYEPSGVQQLPDERFVIVEDESAHPLDLLVMRPDGGLSEHPLYRASLSSWASQNRKLLSVEGLIAFSRKVFRSNSYGVGC